MAMNNVENLYLNIINSADRYSQLCDIAASNIALETKLAMYEEQARKAMHDPRHRHEFRNGVAQAEFVQVAEKLNQYYDNHVREAEAAGHPILPKVNLEKYADDPHKAKWEAISQALGIDNLAQLVPAGPKKVKEALANNDPHLNTIPLAKWDAQNFNVQRLAQAVGYGSWSLSDTVCALKHVAAEHTDRLPLKDSLYLGKCDGYGNGRNTNKAYISWEYDPNKGTFTMSAEVWNQRETDIIRGGQCVDEVAKMFPGNRQAKRMVEVWKEWHLNDMQAGSPAQTAYLEEHAGEWEAYKQSDAYKADGDRSPSHYTWAKKVLTEAGLNPDPNYEHNGKPYNYGSAWLKKEMPAEVVQEILSWGEPSSENFVDKNAANSVNAVVQSMVGSKGLAALKDAAQAEPETTHEHESE